MMKHKKYCASVTVFFSLLLSVLLLMIFTFLRIGIIGSEKQRFELASNLALNSALGEYSRALYEKYDLLYIDASYLEKEPDIDNVTERIEYYMTENSENIYLKANAPWGRIKIDKVLINGFECATSGELRNMTNQAVMYVEDSPSIYYLVDEETEALSEAIGVSSFDNADSIGQFRGYKAAVDGIPLPKKRNEKGKLVEVPVENPADWVYGLSESDIGFLAGSKFNSISNKGTDTSGLISHRGAHNTAGIKGNYSFNDTLYGAYEIDKFGCYLSEKSDTILSLQMEYIAFGNDNDYANFTSTLDRLFRWRLADNLAIAFDDGAIEAEAYAIASELEVSMLNPAFIKPVSDTIIASCAYLETISDIRCILSGGSIPVHKSSHSMRVSNVLDGNIYQSMSNEGLSYRQYLECMIFLEPLEMRLLRNMDLMEMEVRNSSSNNQFCMDYCVEEIDVSMSGNGTGIKEYNFERRYGYF